MFHRGSWFRLAACALIAGALSAARCDDRQTSPSKQVTIKGTLAAGVECPAVQGADGRLYTLTGDLQGFKTGDEVCITGHPVEVSYCMQGTTLAVDSIKPASECR